MGRGPTKYHGVISEAINKHKAICRVCGNFARPYSIWCWNCEQKQPIKMQRMKTLGQKKIKEPLPPKRCLECPFILAHRQANRCPEHQYLYAKSLQYKKL